MVPSPQFDLDEYGVDVGPYVDAFAAACDLRGAALDVPEGAVFVSLGQNCSTAWHLQAIGKRSCSTPFDWIFSSPQIVTDCLRDEFRDFLDLRQAVTIDEHSAGHARYHGRMFNHRNPHVGDNHARLQRSVARFLALYRSDRPLVFVSTALPEHGLRPVWSEGFVHDFAAPANVNPLEDYAALHALVSERAAPTRLIVVEQRTMQARPRIEVTGRSEGMVSIAFDVCGASTGVYYANPRDEALCRALYTALCA